MTEAALDARQGSLRERAVLIVGVGGLGAPAAMHLAAAGVGRLGLVDADVVELSNLPRQILYRETDIGRAKVAVAAERLSRLRPALETRPFQFRLHRENLERVFAGFDFIVDGTDDAATKYLVNDGAVRLGLPYSHAGVVGLQGQTMTVQPGRSACLRCLFPLPPDEDLPTCQAAGVLGPVAGTIAVLQATEALKFLLGLGNLLTDRLLTYDASRARWRTVRVSRRANCAACAPRARFPVPAPPSS